MDYGDGGCGGAIYGSDNISLCSNGTNSFVNNSANYGSVGGGALYISDIVVLILVQLEPVYLSAQLCTGGGGGAIYTSRKTFYGTNNFISNSVDYGGGSIEATI